MSTGDVYEQLRQGIVAAIDGASVPGGRGNAGAVPERLLKHQLAVALKDASASGIDRAQALQRVLDRRLGEIAAQQAKQQTQRDPLPFGFGY
jgi:hypothetical protein